MITNPLLEEIWSVKDRLNAESGGDIHVFCQQLREWSAKNLPRNMAVCDPAELRALLAKEDLEDSLILREEPPEYRRKKD
jgi:hypothetical protein